MFAYSAAAAAHDPICSHNDAISVYNTGSKKGVGSL